MLKIKDTVDLKKLEKFGFEYRYEKVNDCKYIDAIEYYVKNKTGHIIITVCDRRIDALGEDIETIYNLTKARMIEKV